MISLALVGALTFSVVVPFGGRQVYADPADDPETIRVTIDTDTPSAVENDEKQNNEKNVIDASDLETVMAGAAVAVNRYLESDFSYDTSELFERIHIRPSLPTPTETQPQRP